MSQPNRRKVRAHLLPLKAPDRGKVFVLSPGRVVIGSSAEADIVLDGPGLAEMHARIEISEHLELFFENLDSAEGSLLNGKPVSRSSLLEGDTLGLGPEVVVKIEFTDRDVRELIKDLHRSSSHDSLTGLLNRRSFAQRLAQEQAVVSRKKMDSEVCLALLDADHFKSVNDTFGHVAGDAVLKTLAEVMRLQLRTEDELGRYGGEEFIALLRGASLDDALVILNRLREAVAKTAHSVTGENGPEQLHVTVSIGVALLDGSRTADESIARADEALYRAKQTGRNRVEAEPRAL